MRGFCGSDKWEKIRVVRTSEEWEEMYGKSKGWEGFPSSHSGSFPVLVYRLKLSEAVTIGNCTTHKDYCQYLFIEAKDIKELLS